MFTTHDKQDANVSQSPQQAQGSLQAQDILPSALPTTLPQQEQNAPILQPNSQQNLRKLINSLLVSIALVVVVVGTIAWISNITDTTNANIFIALFTSFSTFLTITQIYIQSKEKR